MANMTHIADKGRNLEEEAVVPVGTQVVAAAPVNQTDQSAMTYVDDGKGNIIAGPGVGIPAQEQPAKPVIAYDNYPVEKFAKGAVNSGSRLRSKEDFKRAGITTFVPAPSEEEIAARDAAEQPLANVSVQEVTQHPLADVSEQEIIEQPDTGTAAPTKISHLYDWASGMTFNDAYKQNKHTAREIMDDQWRWAQENGKPLNFYDWATHPEYDADKTKEQNEKEQKKAEKKRKWDALGTFLTHLGNAVGAAGWGGSVKLEDPMKLSERQREIFEKTQALRRQRNKEMMDAYIKQYNTDRQNRLDATKAENEKRKLDRLDEDQRLRVKKQDWLEQYQQGILDDKAERRRIDEEYKKGMISLKERNNQIAELNAMTSRMRENRQAAGTVTTTTDASGNVKTVEKKPAGKQSSGNGGKVKTKSAFGSRTSGKSAFGKR